uniref:DUF1416 domain-containing protein n=1 Tax=Mycobacterium riyadhense TaxID=486698 RepID=A0A653F3W6_9MYCO|nr:hypothetical protein BIN_B_05539 [Mycobacterium riyadhense]
MCSLPMEAIAPLFVVDMAKTVIAGRVVDDSGQPVGRAFVRLSDASDALTAEVVASGTGYVRFFAAPRSWTARTLSPTGTGRVIVAPAGAGIHEVRAKIGD